MLIRQRLQLLVLVPVAVLALIGMAVIIARSELKTAYDRAAIAERLQEHTFGLTILTYDYLRTDSVRPGLQWQAKYASFGETIASIRGFPELNDIKKEYEVVGRLFGELAKSKEAPQDQWVISRLLIYMQSLYMRATRLKHAADRGLQEAIGTVLFFLMVAATMGVAAIAVVIYRVTNIIGQSVARLSDAASMFSSGDLSYRADIRTRDELAQLAASFNNMADRLVANQARLIESEKLVALGTLAAGVAHELNNPMMGVMNYVERVRQHSADPEDKQVLTKALRELARMRDLLKNMLAFSQPLSASLSTTHVARAIERAIDLMGPEFKVFGVRLETRIEPLPDIQSNEDHLQQVLVNVLMNARDALEGRSEKAIRVSATQEPEHIVIDVTDSGPGVPAGHVQKIFDAFFTTKSPGKGTGLGLSVSRNLMLGLGGTIEYVGGKEPGATFRLRLPLRLK